ncbi:MAG TPA: methylenetetrahydrofolate reductase [Spirochaetia bacterium]|nr:methylenetetrahydrofolate reductase [Spirochaetia bacterium]
MKITDLLQSGRFVVTGEVAPPKGTDVSVMLEEARPLAGWVDAVNVTDNQSAVMRLSSLAAAVKLKEAGFEPVYQLTCRDRNRLALQSDLLGAGALGIRNVLLLTGDYVNKGDHPDAKPVYDLDSVQLIACAKALTEGGDMVGNALAGKADICLGAVVSPGTEPAQAQIIKLGKKVAVGASFIQTQAVYDVEEFARFLQAARDYGIAVPVLAGIVMLKSAAMARYMNSKVPGVRVPESLIRELEAAPKEKRSEVSVGITVRLINELRDLVAGVHLMPLGWTHLVPEVLHRAGIRPGEGMEGNTQFSAAR